ncbi:MAG: GWxTD domain-containing protein [Candidatus Aminicenantes bacterium]|nr:GWxTD domain-containing protein [Candidatus Aminicenantes bacterium]MDH5384619.1 GWxTD domain-containing protein [Candidatus Aminicenantes bacterium]MDH5743855.1 GWxTD domain-containing protein [Candidatus Aminicenantes bacterium]
MKFRNVLILLLFLSLTAIPDMDLDKDEKSLKSLPQHHKDWLQKDVAYIITPREKEIFLQLESDKERDIFIEAFWKQRDPTPGTPQNEFKEEHYRRIAYANQYFGRGTTRPGWQTDRGRIYIILGPPLDIGRYEVEGYVHPARIWAYEGIPEFGFPSHFNLVFFKRRGMGEFVLYSPAQDGPANLLVNYQGDPTNMFAAYEQLRKFDPRMAEVSLSLIPGETPSYGHLSLASEMLINRISSVPEKTIDSEYAEALLKFRDLVEVEYTANYIGSKSLAQVIQDESGIFFLHYSIQPEKLSVLSYEDKYSINFDLNGIVTDLDGKVIFQYEKTFPLNFDREQIEDVQKTSIVVQDMIPLVAGDYRFSLLLKNTVSKEFTSFEKHISIPQDQVQLVMTPILLGYQLKRTTSPQEMNKPFKVGNLQISSQSGDIFHPKEDLIVFFQAFGLTKELRDEGTVKFTIYQKEEEFLTQEKRIKDFDQKNFMQKIPLQKFSPDYYKIKVSILDGKKRIIIADDKDFEISPAADLPRPWVVSKVMPSSQNDVYSFILGSQFANKGNLGEAEKYLEKSYNEVPTSLDYALRFGQILFKKKEFQRAKKILLPFSENPKKNFQVFSLLGACSKALEEYEEAISYYKAYLSHAGTNLSILNSIGECFYRLGNTKEALIAWEKSLEINPDQEDIKKIVARLKMKD